MKKIVMKKIMNYVKNNTKYNDTQLLEIEYGLTGIYLTISKMIIISIISLFLGIFKDMIIFMVLFNIIRTFAFGLHATKSWICLISSAIIFVGVPLIIHYLTLNLLLKLFIGILCIIFIFKNSPADTKKRPIVSIRRRLILNYISTTIAILFVIISLIINNNYISNSLIFALILENFLISPLAYKIFNLSYNNYIDFLKSHPDFNN